MRSTRSREVSEVETGAVVLSVEQVEKSEWDSVAYILSKHWASESSGSVFIEAPISDRHMKSEGGVEI